ncbi:MAG: hypothetical protein Q9171_001824 [Xanthocarpia ochracea]
MAAAHLTNASMESSQGMSDIAMDACMRSFDLAMIKAKYLSDIKRDVEDAEDGIFHRIQGSCIAGCPHCTPRNKPFIRNLEDDEIDNLLNPREESDADSDSSVSLESFYDWRMGLSEDDILEDCFTSLDYVISRLVPQESPEFPERILPLLQPGCPRCYIDDAHPLPKYEQYRHDLEDLTELLNDRASEWSDFGRELISHPHWYLAMEAQDNFSNLNMKLFVASSETEWPEHGNEDVDYNGWVQCSEKHTSVRRTF